LEPAGPARGIALFEFHGGLEKWNIPFFHPSKGGFSTFQYSIDYLPEKLPLWAAIKARFLLPQFFL
jgi:hypothetical protein